MAVARGALHVTTEAEPPFLEQDGNKLSRNIVRREFSGDMIGTSEAQMVAVYTGSAGHVAIEFFIGSVEGQSGSLVPSLLSISRVPKIPVSPPVRL